MKSFLWTQFSCLHAGTVCSLDDKSQTDEKRFAQARLKVLYEVNLLSENAIVEVPYPTTAHEDSDVCHESSNGAIFIAVYETIQIFSENGLLRKVSVNSNICGLSILHATKDLCIVLASTFPGDFLLCEIKMKESHLSKNAEAVVSRGHLSKNDFRDFSCIKLKLIVASGDPDQRPILPFCDNMVFIPRKTGSGTRSYHPRSSDQFPILFLGYHRIYGCQLLQSAETVDSCFKLSRMGATQEIAASGAIYADLGPFECASSGVLDRIANCRIITPICGMQNVFQFLTRLLPYFFFSLVSVLDAAAILMSCTTPWIPGSINPVIPHVRQPWEAIRNTGCVHCCVRRWLAGDKEKKEKRKQGKGAGEGYGQVLRQQLSIEDEI